MKGLIIFRGLPGSGKSTLARALVNRLKVTRNLKLTHSEIDQFMVDKQGRYAFERERLPHAIKAAEERALKALHSTGRCVVSNTHTRHFEFTGLVDAARAMGLPVLVFHIQGEFENIHGVPTEAQRLMAERWMSYPGEFHVPVTEEESGLDIVLAVWDDAYAGWKEVNHEFH